MTIHCNSKEYGGHKDVFVCTADNPCAKCRALEKSSHGAHASGVLEELNMELEKLRKDCAHFSQLAENWREAYLAEVVERGLSK